MDPSGPPYSRRTTPRVARILGSGWSHRGPRANRSHVVAIGAVIIISLAATMLLVVSAPTWATGLVLQSHLWLVPAGPVVAVAGALLVPSSPG